MPLTKRIAQTSGFNVLVALPFICAVLAASSLLSQTAPEPVPSKWLRDGKLVVDDFNFSVETPNPNSQWSYVKLPDIQGSKATAFIVAPSPDTKFLIIVWDKAGTMDSESSKALVDGMTKSMPKDWRVADAKIQPSAFPLTNSSKLLVTIRLPDEQTLYVYGYIVTSTRTYEFLDYSPETIEPPEFHHFVGSFAFIKAPTAGNVIVLHQPTNLLGLLCIALFIIAVTRSKKRWKTALYALLTAIVIGLGIGVVMGYMTGDWGAGGSFAGLLMPIILAVASWSHSRSTLQQTSEQQKT